jgi:hypothetical protein
MKRLLASLLLLGFILWVLPLGYFIKPSQEKSICDGQRGLCMCHVFIPKSVEKALDHGFNWRSAPAPNKENNSAGNYFISGKLAIAANPSLFLNVHQFDFSYQNPYLAAFDPVPKF